MPTVKILGRVLPAPVGLSFTTLPEAEWNHPELGYARFLSKITSGIIEIECEVNEYKPDYLPILLKQARELIQACVDLVSFGAGVGLLVVFDTFIEPSNNEVALINDQPMLAGECTVFKIRHDGSVENPEELTRLMRIVIEEGPLFMTLNDLVHALWFQQQTLANCGRVIDGLRKIISPDTDVKRGWAVLQDLLLIDPEYTKLISNRSTNPRHGGREYVSGDEVLEVLRRTWAVMNRFLEFRMRGSIKLPADEFSVLAG